jgi:hypothetical protein
MTTGNEFIPATTDDERDLYRSKLGPLLLEVGQKVWWSDFHSLDLYEGRVTRIELGRGRAYGGSWICREYYFKSEKMYCYGYYADVKEYVTDRQYFREQVSEYDNDVELAYAFTRIRASRSEAEKLIAETLESRIRDLQRDIDRFNKHLSAIRDQQ